MPVPVPAAMGIPAKALVPKQQTSAQSSPAQDLIAPARASIDQVVFEELLQILMPNAAAQQVPMAVSVEAVVAAAAAAAPAPAPQPVALQGCLAAGAQTQR